MATDLLHVQPQSVKKKPFFCWLLSCALAKLKQSHFSSTQFDLEKCATEKMGHLHQEEAKEEKKSQLFPLAKERKGELNCLLSHNKLFNISTKK